MRSKLRRPCRVPAGGIAADVCDCETQATSDRADDGDLPPNVITRGIEARFRHLEQNPGDIRGAVRAQRRVLDPAVAELNHRRDTRLQEPDTTRTDDEDRHDCEMCFCDDCAEKYEVRVAEAVAAVGRDHLDDDDYDAMGNQTPSAQARRAREMLAMPGANGRVAQHVVERGDVADDDTDEEAAKARMRASWGDAFARRK